MSLEKAIEVFISGFAFTRSYTHPYIGEKFQEGFWGLRDAPRKRQDYRGEEYVAYGLSASAIDALARARTRGHFSVCHVQEADEISPTIREDFRALGYQLSTTEFFMTHRLEKITKHDSPCDIERISTLDQAELLAKAARSRQILPAHLAANPPPRRQYMAMDGAVPVGWVGSVSVGGCTWCTNMFVAPSHRRRGIGKALLSRMLTDDRAAGAEANVLLASHAGAKLYPVLGYETIGKLFVFNPPKGDPAL